MSGYELVVAFELDWSDVMPTREELIEWLHNRKEPAAKRKHYGSHTWCGHCGYGFGDDTWMRYCPSCGYKVIADAV